MPAIAHITTIALVARSLGQNEDQLFDLACDQLEPEDGLIWILDTDERQTIALTDSAIEMLQNILAEQRSA
jgi:uncharacterized protein YciU (UPF0263 family)